MKVHIEYTFSAAHRSEHGGRFLDEIPRKDVYRCIHGHHMRVCVTMEGRPGAGGTLWDYNTLVEVMAPFEFTYLPQHPKVVQYIRGRYPGRPLEEIEEFRFGGSSEMLADLFAREFYGAVREKEGYEPTVDRLVVRVYECGPSPLTGRSVNEIWAERSYRVDHVNGRLVEEV